MSDAAKTQINLHLPWHVVRTLTGVAIYLVRYARGAADHSFPTVVARTDELLKTLEETYSGGEK